jgi:hypothetical protein
MTDLSVETLMNRGLNKEAALIYNQFGNEYRNLSDISPLDGIIEQKLRMYAADKMAEIDDYSDIIKKINNCYPSLKKICSRPKSHLKSINEVRPIDTVKRIGYESISYLASHSEDWLARTAAGLKPARLFSRVEEVDYHIYENRVVKILIDTIIRFIITKIDILENKYGQIQIMVNRDTQTYSYDFDRDFQIAVNTLLPRGLITEDEHLIKGGRLAKEMLNGLKNIKRKFIELKQSRLYKLLYNTKQILNPLDETNILLFDKDYNNVFYLWKEMHFYLTGELNEEAKEETSGNQQESYYDFCYSLVQFSLDSLKFESVNTNYFIRKQDNIAANLIQDEHFIKLNIKDITKRSMPIENGLVVPLEPGKKLGKFSRCGNDEKLFWENDVTDKEIEEFCKKLVVSSDYQEKNIQSRQYKNLNIKILDINKNAGKPKEAYINIYPVCCEIQEDEEYKFKRYIQTNHLFEDKKAGNFNIVALPLVQKTEQKLTDYAVNLENNIAVLPISLFDINSYRRMQRIFLRQLLDFTSDKCPNCGNDTRGTVNGMECDKCKLIITNTKCPLEECGHEFKYIWFRVTEEKIKSMQIINNDDFFNKDGLFKYKNVIDLKIEENKLSPICPKCYKL